MRHTYRLIKDTGYVMPQQILNVGRLDRLCRGIIGQARKGKSVYYDVSFITYAEVIYLRLYGYRVEMTVEGYCISW